MHLMLRQGYGLSILPVIYEAFYLERCQVPSTFYEVSRRV